MTISKRIVATGTAGVLALGGLGVTVLGAPIAAAGTTASGSAAGGSRLQAVRDALAGLVTDGTLTQAQADWVATTLESSDALRHGGRGGRGFGLDAAAEALGMSVADLHTALHADGATLAGVAEEKGVDRQVVVDALVAAGEERLEQAVTDGRLTREQADERIAALPAQVEAMVDGTFRGRGGRGPGGPRGSAPAPSGGTSDGASESGAPGGTQQPASAPTAA